ncbi:hypothetical protein PX52LOC_06850 [Limnoglobus roseus]|uniref:Uncharacterized protein n=1 Tax=Limnoglobus roseus TaxID=2598579 RepID=A0A5C1AKM6_9BACT|nr:hypothetical protein PX52LOC_06850 [Limnoglobus roseus]
MPHSLKPTTKVVALLPVQPAQIVLPNYLCEAAKITYSTYRELPILIRQDSAVRTILKDEADENFH